MRHLINNDGRPFEISELQTLHDELDALDDNGRKEYRDRNSSAIAENISEKILIVSGPGTGKSTLFLDRIKYWYKQDSHAKVFVISFVRKLVADLQNDINNNPQLTNEQKSSITASTLHKFARSIVEQNRGTTEWRFKPHFQIIGQTWKDVVWNDVLFFYADIDVSIYSWEKFEEQLHNAEINESTEWQNLKKAYFKLCSFYNAAGFADLIIRATDALTENHHLNESKYFIIDEYQDFNAAEDALINRLVIGSRGLLIAGDDEQVLYEKSRSGKPILIRNLYQNHDYVNGMLPFCSRSKDNFHITKSADFFINQNRNDDCIKKIYLPIKTTTDCPKTQVIACSSPNSAVDYIEKFVTDNKTDIDERKSKLTEGKEKDAFLLILTPRKIEKFLVNKKFNGKEKIESLISEYQTENRYFSEDYYKVLNYYSLTSNHQNNFTFRKVLHHENTAENRMHELIEEAMGRNQALCDLESEEIRDAIQKCNDIKVILEAGGQTIEQKIKKIAGSITITDKDRLKEDIVRKPITPEEVVEIKHQEDEDAELEEIEVKKMGAIELMSIIGSKGLSADHVIIIGFDNVNMGNWITQNAFYVAMTRARKSLHILTALKSGGSSRAHNFLEQLTEEHVEYNNYTKTNRIKSQLRGKLEFKQWLNNLNLMTRQRR